ncbi:solute carrier family 46 member 3-like [Coccinella septempunctata]|uniref:solute carrier family 46 member 3-like n=1 Tax=Coccinella septempunctata TaxID=41139 RepID=UPI001D05CC75|nr:solute carrier family 46 member 3-like [Coccinella septempunctata]XP_044756635.1 solute carrier family 46 member 3-like [Coccinella septempunctata]
MMEDAVNETSRLSETEEKHDLRSRSKLFRLLEIFSVEPVILFYIIFAKTASLTTDNLNLEKTCSVNLKFNASVCQAMVVRNRSGYSADQEIEVQKFVAMMVAIKFAILGIIPFFLMLFLGSWSDKYKRRKPLILLPICGDIVSVFGCLLCSYFFFELPVEVAIFFETIPASVTGSWVCFSVGVFCYVAEHSTLDRRTPRIGITTMCFRVSHAVGLALSGVLYRTLGFKGVYSLCILMNTIALMYGKFMINNRSKYEEPRANTNIMKDIFNYKYALSTLSVIFRQKDKKKKLGLILLLLINTIEIGILRGELGVTYLFTRRKFTWDEVDYSVYSTYHILIQFTGSFLSITILAKWLKLDDALIGMISVGMAAVLCFGQSLVPNGFFFYTMSSLDIFSGCPQMAYRSMFSKMVSSKELGQAFAVSALFEALAPLLFGTMYSFVYRQTIRVYPGSFYILSSCLHIVSFCIFFSLYISKHNKPKEDSNIDQGRGHVMQK